MRFRTLAVATALLAIAGAAAADTYTAKTTISTGSTYTPYVLLDTGAAVQTGVAQGSTTSGQLGELGQGAVTTANPSYTTGQTCPLSLTTSGLLRIGLYSSAGTAIGIDSGGIIQTRVIASALGGATGARVMSAATTNATSVKASSGAVYGVDLHNSGAAVVFVKLYNKASAPTVGTDVPVETIAIPAGGRVDYSYTQGVAFSTGIAYAITNLVADSDTTAVTLNQVTGKIAYQ